MPLRADWRLELCKAMAASGCKTHEHIYRLKVALIHLLACIRTSPRTRQSSEGPPAARDPHAQPSFAQDLACPFGLLAGDVKARPLSMTYEVTGDPPEKRQRTFARPQR